MCLADLSCHLEAKGENSTKTIAIDFFNEWDHNVHSFVLKLSALFKIKDSLRQFLCYTSILLSQGYHQQHTMSNFVIPLDLDPWLRDLDSLEQRLMSRSVYQFQTLER